MANTFYSFDGGDPAQQKQTINTTTAPAGVDPTTNLGDTVEITSTGGNGSIFGFNIDSAGGNDTVSLNGSPNLTKLTLGAGNDILTLTTSILGGSITSSIFEGAEGNDTFNLIAAGTGAASSFFGGGNGADLFSLRGNFNNVTIAGGADRDRVQFLAAGGKATNSLFVLGSGDDTLQDQLFGILVSGSTVEGGGGDDLIDFQASTAGTGVFGLSIGGGNGEDEILGTKAGENTVLGGADNDFIQTFDGNDSIGGGSGADTIFTGKGADFAFGGGGADIIFGQFGQNTLSGGNGADIVVGGVADDLIFGNAEFENDQGDDTLIGGEGDDTAVAGSGDTWIYGDGVNALLGLFNPFTPGVNWVVNSVQNGGAFKANDFTAAHTFGDGGETNLTSFFALKQSLLANPDLGNGLTASTEYWLGQNPSLNIAGILAGTVTPTKDQLEYLADIDNLLVENTPGINPANGKFIQFINVGDDSLQGNSGDDVIFGGQSALGAGINFFGFGFISDGNYAIDKDTIEGNGGDDVIMGGIGADSMSGGIGSDLFLQEWGASNVVDFNFFPPRTALEVGNNINITFAGTGPDRVDVITDFKAADDIGAIVDRLSFQGWNGQLQNNLGAATNGFLAGDVVLYSGIYNRVAGTFITTSNLAGPDVLAFRAAGTAFIGGVDALDAGDFGDQAVVLLGASKEAFTINNFI